MSKATDIPMRARRRGYCPECRAAVEHDRHREVPIPPTGKPPKGEYAPEHRPVDDRRS